MPICIETVDKENVHKMTIQKDCKQMDTGIDFDKMTEDR
jgi:hypothetical protein